MGTSKNDFQEYVLPAMTNYTSLTFPVKAALPERTLVSSAPVTDLHPNPDDEFTDPEVGPSAEITGEYTESIMAYDCFSRVPHVEPIIVQKLSTGGYMILNGHHRWLAALKLDMKRVPVKIVNTTQEKDILAHMKKLDNSMCISFDLDEVLICRDGRYPVETLPVPLRNHKIWPIRKDAHLLINTLRRKGFDVWLYTCSYYPPSYIRAILRMYRTGADGIITGMNLKKVSSDLRYAFAQKYHTTLHIDNERLLWVDTVTKEFRSFELPGDGTWARQAAEYAIGLSRADKEGIDT